MTAQTGDAWGVALESISGPVAAGRHALAASLGDITGEVTATAGHATAVAGGGGVTGDVSAGLSAGVFALGQSGLKGSGAYIGNPEWTR